jgi:hypothetical protein
MRLACVLEEMTLSMAHETAISRKSIQYTYFGSSMSFACKGEVLEDDVSID